MTCKMLGLSPVPSFQCDLAIAGCMKWDLVSQNQLQDGVTTLLQLEKTFTLFKDLLKTHPERERFTFLTSTLRHGKLKTLKKCLTLEFTLVLVLPEVPTCISMVALMDHTIKILFISLR